MKTKFKKSKRTKQYAYAIVLQEFEGLIRIEPLTTQNSAFHQLPTPYLVAELHPKTEIGRQAARKLVALSQSDPLDAFHKLHLTVVTYQAKLHVPSPIASRFERFAHGFLNAYGSAEVNPY